MFSGKELDLRAPFDLLDSYELNEEEIRIRRFNEMVNEADALWCGFIQGVRALEIGDNIGEGGIDMWWWL